MAHHSELPAIIIDTREQLPYEFIGYETQVATLATGDYSLQGYEHRVAVERKSLEDAYQCVGAGRRRFVDCLQRLGEIESPAIVIEASLKRFAIPPPRTRIDQRMAIGSYISWSCMYRIPVFWADNRDYAERVVVRFLAAFIKWRANGNKSVRSEGGREGEADQRQVGGVGDQLCDQGQDHGQGG